MFTPQAMSNQCKDGTCTVLGNQSVNHVMSTTNHHLTCKTVFLLIPSYTYSINYGSIEMEVVAN